MVSLSTEPPSVLVSRLVAETLAADAELAAFFEGRISSAQAEEMRLPFAVPSLFACTTGEARKRQPGGHVYLQNTVQIRAYFPRMALAAGWVPVPAFTLTSAGGSSYQYRLTQFGSSGESWASEAVFSWGLGTLALPAFSSGFDGYRIWRSEAGKSACRWAATVRKAGQWADPGTATKPEIAPVRGLGERIVGMIESIFCNETTDAENLPTGGGLAASGALQQKSTIGKITNRNLDLYSLEVLVSCLYNPVTQTIRLSAQ